MPQEKLSQVTLRDNVLQNPPVKEHQRTPIPRVAADGG
jgi:hypothetical protein